jgi:hypothetical protein
MRVLHYGRTSVGLCCVCCRCTVMRTYDRFSVIRVRTQELSRLWEMSLNFLLGVLLPSRVRNDFTPPPSCVWISSLVGTLLPASGCNNSAMHCNTPATPSVAHFYIRRPSPNHTIVSQKSTSLSLSQNICEGPLPLTLSNGSRANYHHRMASQTVVI